MNLYSRTVCLHTDMTASYIQQLEQVNNLTCDNVQLKSQLENTQMYEDNFQDSKKVQGYTGLPNLCILPTILDIINPVVYETCCALTKFQQLMLCLMKLRFSLPFIILADIFPQALLAFIVCLTVCMLGPNHLLTGLKETVSTGVCEWNLRDTLETRSL